MRILGSTASGYSTSNYSVLTAPTSGPTGVSATSATNPSGFMSGNGYYVKYGATLTSSANGNISYATSMEGPWTLKAIQSSGEARGINYIDTGSNKYWVYGNATTGTFSYTTDGTPHGALSTVTPNTSNATSSTMLVYCAGAARPFVAVGGSSTTGIYVYTATTINGTYTSATHASQTGSVSVQGIAWGGTGTGSDKRLIFTCGGNAAGATYFSAANDTTSYTVQTVSIGDCRGLAYTGTHWLYLGDNQFGRALASSFNNTTGNSITAITPEVYPGTVRGLAAAPDGSGLCYLSGGSTIGYSTNHGLNWSSVSAPPTLTSLKMHMGSNIIVAYSSETSGVRYQLYP
jgi:hypothetical protein